MGQAFLPGDVYNLRAKILIHTEEPFKLIRGKSFLKREERLTYVDFVKGTLLCTQY